MKFGDKASVVVEETKDFIIIDMSRVVDTPLSPQELIDTVQTFYDQGYEHCDIIDRHSKVMFKKVTKSSPEGLSKREHFAATVLQGLLAKESLGHSEEVFLEQAEAVTNAAVYLTDLMLKKLEKDK